MISNWFHLIFLLVFFPQQSNWTQIEADYGGSLCTGDSKASRGPLSFTDIVLYTVVTCYDSRLFVERLPYPLSMDGPNLSFAVEMPVSQKLSFWRLMKAYG